MNRLGKVFRVSGGIAAFLNVVVFFLPMTQSIRENYPTKKWSQLQYVQNVMTDAEPFMESYTASRMVWVICLIVVPMLIAAFLGIFSAVQDRGQIVTFILAGVMFGLYLGLFFSVTGYYPNPSYQREIAGTLNLICAGISFLCAVAGLITMPKKKKVETAKIPNLHEIKKDRIEVRYHVIEHDNVDTANQPQLQPQPQPAPYVPGEPRGVMVGLNGLYKGAEIPFQNGEIIKLGRNADNDLIFDENQKKVSREHCTIKWDANSKEFLIYDRSTNGTYLNGMDDCMPKHLEIIAKPGTVLSLGDENNTFRLE